jgi:ribosomal protein S18 acetylase RimI-like enzyme
MTPVRIAQADWRDAWALWQLDKRCFSSVGAYSLFTYLSMCLARNVLRLKAVDRNTIVGFVAADRRGDYIGIVTLGVHPDWRRRGIATRLMQMCEAQTGALRFRLRVPKDNAGAIQVYHKLGYHIVRALPDYYRGKGGYLMEKIVE